MATDPQDIQSLLANADWIRVEDDGTPIIGDVVIKRRIDQLPIGSATDIRAYLDTVRYYDDPVTNRETAPGRYRLSSYKVEGQFDVCSITQTLRKGYADEIDWDEARLISPAKYQPVSEKLDIIWRNLNPEKLRDLSASSELVSPVVDPAVNGEVYTGSWLKWNLTAYQDPDDGSGVILLELTKGGHELVDWEVHTSCLVDSYFTRYWAYTKEEIDEIAVAITAQPAQAGWIREDPVITFDKASNSYDLTMVLRKRKVDDPTALVSVTVAGRRIQVARDHTIVPTSGIPSTHRAVSLALTKNDHCTTDSTLTTEDAPELDVTQEGGGRRTRIAQNKAGAVPDVPAGRRLLQAQAQTSADGRKDFTQTTEAIVPLDLERTDGGRRIVVGQDSAAEFPSPAEDERIAGLEASVKPDEKKDFKALFEKRQPLDFTITGANKRAVRILQDQTELPSVPVAGRLLGANLTKKPDGRIDGQIQTNTADAKVVDNTIHDAKRYLRFGGNIPYAEFINPVDPVTERILGYFQGQVDQDGMVSYAGMVKQITSGGTRAVITQGEALLKETETTAIDLTVAEAEALKVDSPEVGQSVRIDATIDDDDYVRLKKSDVRQFPSSATGRAQTGKKSITITEADGQTSQDTTERTGNELVRVEQTQNRNQTFKFRREVEEGLPWNSDPVETYNDGVIVETLQLFGNQSTAPTSSAGVTYSGLQLNDYLLYDYVKKTRTLVTGSDVEVLVGSSKTWERKEIELSKSIAQSLVGAGPYYANFAFLYRMMEKRSVTTYTYERYSLSRTAVPAASSEDEEYGVRPAGRNLEGVFVITHRVVTYGAWQRTFDQLRRRTDIPFASAYPIIDSSTDTYAEGF